MREDEVTATALRDRVRAPNESTIETARAIADMRQRATTSAEPTAAIPTTATMTTIAIP